MTSFTLPQWYDLHMHLRQGALLAPLIQAQRDMGCAGVLAMPNTKPPVGKILAGDDLPYWSIEEYLDMIRAAGGDQFIDVIVPLYLTKDTTAQMIEGGVKSGVLRAAKYYPPHGTTNAGHGQPLDVFIENGVLEAMESQGVVLCVHGEAHGLPAESYFDADVNAEDIFYRRQMPRLAEKFPKLKIVCEHITTRAAAGFVRQAGPNVAATVTPQHLLYTAGHLMQGLNYHLYCLPVVKFEKDRAALREAVTDSRNTQFFAGTDSAPHTQKATECGCAAGCFTGGIAPQLYAQGFEEAGADLSTKEDQHIFRAFLCENGPAFYGLPMSQKTFTLTKKSRSLAALETSEGPVIPLPLGLGHASLPWSIET
ncbi:MAG: dihydroorotase [Rhodospirillales bacterium]|nr:dihydroorotase [Alphaproteobacteria bacterium]USO04161.1 MAG: dihydroorotase [Rhodospirillales bacterium]